MDFDDVPPPYRSEHRSPPTQTSASQSASTKAKPTGKERPSNLTPEQSQALDEKEAGNEAYKKKDFDKALLHYDKAVELDPTNATYLTNKAGTLQLDYDLAFPDFRVVFCSRLL